MSQENVLKKEWSKKDVNRARNLIQGKTNTKTTEGIGYSKKEEFHKEGDVWVENGRKDSSKILLNMITLRRQLKHLYFVLIVINK